MKYRAALVTGALALAPLLSAQSSFAGDKYALVLGGGGEPPGEKTIFDDSIDKQLNTLSKFGYRTTVAFDGGHKKTEAIVGAKRKWVSFQAKSGKTSDMELAVQDMIRDVREGRIKPGDKLLVSVDTHGSPYSAGKKKRLTHEVCSADGGFDMDLLIHLKLVCEANGVKLAVIDSSCFSGNTQRLASSKTCVLSAASPDNIGTGAFVRQLWDGLSSGKSLEESFRDTGEYSVATPMISSPAGREMARVFAPMSGILQDPDLMRMRYVGNAKADCASCNIGVTFWAEQAKVNALVEDVKKAMDKPGWGAGLTRGMLFGQPGENLAKAVFNYRQELLVMLEALKKTETPFAQKEMKVFGRDYTTETTVRSLAMMKDEAFDDIAKKEASLADKVRALRDKLRNTNSEFVQLEKDCNTYLDLLAKHKGRRYISSNLVALKEAYNTAYGYAYDYFRKTTATQPNPCRDFSL